MDGSLIEFIATAMNQEGGPGAKSGGDVVVSHCDQ